MTDRIESWSSCPGCGVALPGPDEAWDARSTASVACHELYGEVLGFEHQHLAEVGRSHQLLVDTYTAQHVGPNAAAITGAFALVGLYLALERGWSGLEVRDAHQALANRYRDWPRFAGAARAQAAVTVEDLALAATTSQYAETLHRWARAVWASWRDEHGLVRALVGERLPSGIVSGRIDQATARQAR
jgi:Family of unknown function (DUF5946)